MWAGRYSAEPWGEPSAARASPALPVVFVECSAVLGMVAKQIARRKLLAGAGMDPIQVGYDLLQADAFGITQRASSKNREAGAENHPVVRVFRGGDDFFFETTRRLVHHQIGQTIGDVLKTEFLAGFLPPFLHRLVRRLLFAFVPVNAGTGFAAQDFRRVHFL